MRLEQNYRSTKRILRVADQLIQHNTRRKQKQLFTDNDEGEPVAFLAQPNQKTEADGSPPHRRRSGRRSPATARLCDLLSRERPLAAVWRTSLREHCVPYQMVNGLEFYQRKEIKDVLAYLHLLNNPRDDVAFLRIINTPPRGIGKTTIDALVEHAERTGTAAARSRARRPA